MSRQYTSKSLPFHYRPVILLLYSILPLPFDVFVCQTDNISSFLVLHLTMLHHLQILYRMMCGDNNTEAYTHDSEDPA